MRSQAILYKNPILSDQGRLRRIMRVAVQVIGADHLEKTPQGVERPRRAWSVAITYCVSGGSTPFMSMPILTPTSMSMQREQNLRALCCSRVSARTLRGRSSRVRRARAASRRKSRAAPRGS